MGTRGLVRVFDERDAELVCIYRQFDCYPGGLGVELKDFIAARTIVNGIGAETATVSNGAGCFAAQLVTALKESADKPGNVYLYPPGSTNCGEEFEYHIHVKEAGTTVGFIGYAVQGGFGGKPRKLVKVKASEYKR